jgi:hypothetical protein
MPYNTRRKSLSLPSLGIHLPNASRAHRSPSTSKASSTSDALPPPPKRVKRSHDSGSKSPPALLHERRLSEEKDDYVLAKTPNATSLLENTPPPSPSDVEMSSRIDTEGINDDIVVAVIEQLEKTCNRPHLIKELATVLAPINDSIAK